MRILLIDNGTTLLNKLQQLIPGNEITHTYDDFDKDTEEFDLVILSGGASISWWGMRINLLKK